MTDIKALETRYAPEREDLDRVLVLARDFVVGSDDEAATAAELRAEFKRRQGVVEAEQKGITDPINAGLKAIRAFFKPFSERWELAAGYMDRHLLGWDQQKRMAQRAAEEAAARAAAEAAELRARAAELSANPLPGSAALAASVQAAADAKALEVRANVIASVIPVAKTPGVAIVANWKAQVTDLGALVAWAVATGQVAAILQPNQAALDALAKATRTEDSPIPGVRFYNDPHVSGRR